MGGPGALGTTINIPFPPETPDEGIHYVLDELVLPILNDFRPDLIVNSAGQDNHYTDPLANMRWSAQGYALLNEKLSPDIAVLEGGYAIETALPYVNTAIILAMAGLDYSCVREPDYVPGRFEMTYDMEESISGIVEYQEKVWEMRDSLRSAAMDRAGSFYKRRKNIFYDTDRINETQVEMVKMCPRCPGYITIETQGARGRGILAMGLGVFVPLFGCKECREEALEVYEAGKEETRFNYVYLQDKTSEDYRCYDARGRKERGY
jgi:hypothetical protein